MSGNRSRTEDKIQQLRERKLRELQQEQQATQQQEAQKEMVESDKLWNGAIYGMRAMVDSIVLPPSDEYPADFNRFHPSPDRFKQGFDLAAKSMLLLQRFKPDDSTLLNDIIDAEILPQLEAFNEGWDDFWAELGDITTPQ